MQTSCHTIFMPSPETFGAQFNCPECGSPQYDASGYTPHDHMSFKLGPVDIDHIKALAQAGRMSADADEIERTRRVDLGNRADLVDHLASDKGHLVGPHAEWRNSYPELGPHIPGVRDSHGEDFKLTDAELRTIHMKLHEHWD